MGKFEKYTNSLARLFFYVFSIVYFCFGGIGFYLEKISIVGLFFLMLMGLSCLVIAEVISIKIMLSKLIKKMFFKNV